MNKQEVENLLQNHIFDYRGRPAIEMENAGLDFKMTLLYYGVTSSGNVKLGEIYSEGPEGIKAKNKIAKIRIIGGKKTLALGSGRGTDNYYLDL